MCSIIKVEVEGETLHFRGKDDVDAQCKLDLWIEREVISRAPKEKNGEYLKISRSYGEEFLPLEVEFYEHLEGTGLSPKLLRYGTFFSFRTEYAESGLSIDNKMSFIAVERFGRSLEEIYGSSPQCLNSSEKMRRDKRVFDATFPPERFPKQIKKSLVRLIGDLSKACFDHQDFHAGNVLMNEKGALKVIDFECARIFG